MLCRRRLEGGKTQLRISDVVLNATARLFGLCLVVVLAVAVAAVWRDGRVHIHTYTHTEPLPDKSMNLADFKHQREIQDILRATNPLQKILGKETASDLLVPESRLVLIHPCSFVQDVAQGLVLPVDYSRHQQAMLSSALLSQPPPQGGGGGLLLYGGDDRSALAEGGGGGGGGGDAAERLLMSRQSSATLVSVATLNNALEPHEILLEKTMLNTRSRRHQRQLKHMLSHEVARSRQRLLLCRSGVLDPYGYQEALERLHNATTTTSPPPSQVEDIDVSASSKGIGGRRKSATLGEAIDTHNTERNGGRVDSPHFSSEEGSEIDDDGVKDNNSSCFGDDLLTSHLASLRSHNTGRLTGHHNQSFFFTDLPDNDDDVTAMNSSTLDARAMKLSARLAGASSSIPLSLLSKGSSHLVAENAGGISSSVAGGGGGGGGAGRGVGIHRRRGSFLRGDSNTNNSGDTAAMYHNPFRAPVAGSEEETLQRKQSRRSTDAGGSFLRRRSSLVHDGSFTLALQKADDKIHAANNSINNNVNQTTTTSPRSNLRKRNQANMFGSDVTCQEEGGGGVHRRSNANARRLSITTTVTVSPSSSRGTSPNISPKAAQQRRRRRSTTQAGADVELEDGASGRATVAAGVDEWTPSASMEAAGGATAAIEDFNAAAGARRHDPILFSEAPSSSGGGGGGGVARQRTASPQVGVNNRSLSSPLKASVISFEKMSEEDKQRGLLEKQRELFFKFPDFKASAVLAREDYASLPAEELPSAAQREGHSSDARTAKQHPPPHNNRNNVFVVDRSASSLQKSPVRGGGTLSPISQHLTDGASTRQPQHSHRLGLVAQRRRGDKDTLKKELSPSQATVHHSNAAAASSQHQLSQQQHLHQQIQQQRHAAMSKLARCVHNVRLEPLASGQKHQEIMKLSHDTIDRLSAAALEKLERRVREQPAKYAKKFAALDLNGKLPFHASAGAVLEHVEHLILQQERESSRRDAHDKIAVRLDEIASYCLGRFQHPAARHMILKTQKLVVDEDAIPTVDMFTTRIIHDCPPHMFLLDELTTVAVHLAEIYGMTRDDAVRSIRQYAKAFVVDRRDGVANRLGGGGGGGMARKWSDEDEDDDIDVGGSMLR
jgi:hypothetical protein